MRKLLLISSNTIHTYKYLKLVEDYFDEIVLITNEKSTLFNYTTIVMSFNLNIRSLISTVKEIKKIILQFQPSVIHIHQANSYAFYAHLANRKTKIKTVLTAWGSDVLIVPKRNYLLKLIVQYNLRTADFLTSDSKFMANEMKKLSSSIKEVLIANFGIDVIPENIQKEKIIYSNRLHKKLYRVDKIIEAFGRFLNNGERNDWSLVIAASGTETDKFITKSKELGLFNNIQFVGWVSKEENQHWYSKAKIWVSIPESDATSISLLEAMACGCIPIVSDLPANREWIKSGVNGIVVKDLESDFISEALIINEINAIELNKKRIMLDGSKESNREKFINLYKQL